MLYVFDCLLQATATNAQARESKIQSLVENANYGTDPFLKEFGVHVSTQMQQMNARVLEPPTIMYNTTSSVCLLLIMLNVCN